MICPISHTPRGTEKGSSRVWADTENFPQTASIPSPSGQLEVPTSLLSAARWLPCPPASTVMIPPARPTHAAGCPALPHRQQPDPSLTPCWLPQVSLSSHLPIFYGGPNSAARDPTPLCAPAICPTRFHSAPWPGSPSGAATGRDPTEGRGQSGMLSRSVPEPDGLVPAAAR